MRICLFILTIFISMSTSAQQDFSKLKWKNRIIVFNTPSLSNEDFKNQWDAFMEFPKKISDRNILLFVLVKGKIYDNDLRLIQKMEVAEIRKKYQLTQSYPGFILIGKDGGVKSRKEYFIDPKDVFLNIDQMPMRQQEMKQNIIVD